MNYIFTFLCFTALTASGQIFQTDTILYNGSPFQRINFVFVGDGYTGDEMDKYIDDVRNAVDGIFNQSPFKEYKSYFNVYAIKVVSNESGVSHPQLFKDTNPNCEQTPKLEVDNYFKSSLDAGINFHHLIIPDGYIVQQVVLQNVSWYNQIFVIVNTPYYGGSGGQLTTFTLNSAGTEVCLHELGHSFGLSDEYWPGANYAFEKPNLTQESNPNRIKWKNWLNVNDIGIFLVPGSTGWYRPHQSCKMTVPGYDYCSVCKEAIVEKIHDKIEYAAYAWPSTGTLNLNGLDLELRLTPIKPEPNTQRIIWKMNGKVIGKNVESVVIPYDQISDGYQKLFSAELMDTTHYTRSETHVTSHLYVFEWKIDGLVTGVEIENSVSQFDVQVWPNPYYDKVNATFRLSEPTYVELELVDTNGSVLEKIIRKEFEPGKHSIEFRNMSTKSIHFLIFDFNGTKVPVKVISN